MNNLYLILLFFIFSVVFAIVFFIFLKIANLSIDSRISRIKLQTLREGISRELETSSWIKFYLDKLVKLSSSGDAREVSPLKLQFLRAGYHNDSTAFYYFVFKSIFTISFLILSILFFLIEGNHNHFLTYVVCIFCAGFGYYLPNLWIRHKVNFRKEQIFQTFPDAIDLIRICVSSGLSLDASIARVGNELSLTSKTLSQEFHILSLELRAGATRENALKNFASRTGVEDIQALVSMLIQSGRFGISVAESLRVHAKGLRTKRRLKAQEIAAKIPAKLSIPMILCIFPSLFVVILGPSVLGVVRMLMPIMANK